MTTTLLEICRNVSEEVGVEIDSSIVGSDNKATKQILAICNRIAREIADSHSWPQLQKQGSITLASGTSTYDLPGDINWAYHETFWNRNEEWPIYGPYSPQDRQYLKSGIVNRYPYQRYTFRGMTDSYFEIDPEPTSSDDGSIVVFEYQSLRPLKPLTWATGLNVSVGDNISYNGNYYTAASAGTTGSTAPTHTSGTDSDGTVSWTYYDGPYVKFTNDNDEPVLNPKTFEQGVLERFSARHGVAIEARYEMLLQRDMEKATPGKYIDMLGRPRVRYPNAPGADWAS